MAKKKKADRRLTTPMKGKLILVFGGIIFLFLILVVRLCYVTATKGKEYETAVLSQQKHDSTILPFERGKIYDRNGNILATNEKIYTLILEPQNILLQDKKYEEATINALHEYFGFSKSKLKKTIEDNPYSYYEVYKKNMTYDEVEKFQKFLDLADTSTKGVSKAKKAKIESAKMVKGVSFEEDYKRVYPYNSLACRVLGYTSSGNVGNWGIEQYYNSQLNGVNGRAYYYFNEELDQEQSVKEPKNGNSVVSTIDMQIQKIIEEKLKKFDSEIGSEATNILVMNPQNGEILAMADSTGYDLNNPWDLSAYYTPEQIASMDEQTTLDNLNGIWQNFCTTYTYEPGSTAKPFTVATGLETGKLNGDETYFCDGYQEVGGHMIKCVAYAHGGHGVETIEKAIMNSCNDALMQMADTIGKDEFSKYQKIFNFGLKTNIDLPGEARTDTLVKGADEMGSADLATYSFGQNFNVTMIQLASGFSSIINGGNYYQPHLVKKIVDDNGNTVQTVEPVLLKQTISKQTSDTVKGYLYNTVSAGTAKSAKVEGYSMGGKTGTAEKYPRRNGKYLVSFIGFAPVENPQVLVYVVINEPNVENQAQSSLATNLAKDIFTELFPYMNIYKDEEDPQAQENAQSQEQQQQMTPEEQSSAQENYTDNIFN